MSKQLFDELILVTGQLAAYQEVVKQFLDAKDFGKENESVAILKMRQLRFPVHALYDGEKDVRKHLAHPGMTCEELHPETLIIEPTRPEVIMRAYLDATGRDGEPLDPNVMARITKDI